MMHMQIRHPNARRMQFGRLSRLFFFFAVITAICYGILMSISTRRFKNRVKTAHIRGYPDFYDSETENWYDFEKFKQANLTPNRLNDFVADQTAIKERQVTQLVDLIRRKHVPMMRKWVKQLLSRDAEVKNRARNAVHVLQFRCNAPFRCGALGDRFRGMVALFYVALFTGDTIFDVQWLQPDNLERYFAINSDFYDEDRDQFEEAFFSRKEISMYDFSFGDDEKRIESQFMAVAQLVKQHVMTRIKLNSLLPLQKIRSHPSFQENIRDYNLTNTSNEVLFAAALRFILAKPQPRLSSFVDSIYDQMSQNSPTPQAKLIKIGVQIGLENMAWFEKDRVEFAQIACFATEVHQVAREIYRKSLLESPASSMKAKPEELFKFAVYITAENADVVKEFNAQLSDIPNSPVSKAIQVFTLHGSNVSQVDTRSMAEDNESDNDESPAQVDDESLWKLNVKTFADWLMLTRMDRLVISRSSFGETAAIYSIKQTRRFLHRKSVVIDGKPKCFFEDYDKISLRREPS